MMNKIRIIFTLIGMTFLLVNLNAQGKIKIPKPPREPKFDFEIGNIFKMKPEEERKALSKLKTSVKEQLKVIKKYNSPKYYQLLRESQFKFLNFSILSKLDKKEHSNEEEIFEKDVTSEALAAKYKNAGNYDKKKLKTQLKKTLSTLFDLKEERRKDEVKKLEEELRELKKSLKIRMQNKDEIVKRRLHELLDEDDYLEWEWW